MKVRMSIAFEVEERMTYEEFIIKFDADYLKFILNGCSYFEKVHAIEIKEITPCQLESQNAGDTIALSSEVDVSLKHA